MKQILNYFLSRYTFNSNLEKFRTQSLVLFILSSLILLLFFILNTILTQAYSTLYTQFAYVFFGVLALILIKFWHYKFAGNILSIILVFTELFSMFSNFSNSAPFNFFIDEFYILIIFLFFSTMFANRLVLIINTILILASSIIAFNVKRHDFPSDFDSEFSFGMSIYVITVVSVFVFSYLYTHLILKAIKEISEKALDTEQKSRELTEKQKLLKLQHEDLMRAKEKTEESDKLKTIFLANMSHEIKTPMNSILGLTELLRSTKLNSKQDDYAKVIENSGKHLVDLIDDIIDYAKVEAKQLPIVEGKCKVNVLLDDIISGFNLQLKNETDIKIKAILGLENDDAIIVTDIKRLRQIIINLVSNSIKFTESGSIIIAYIKQKNNKLLFSIKDTGIGIKKDQIPIIFNRFRQGDESNTRRIGGTGLGLSISKAFIELFGGKIWVESEFGKGSTFYFTIPYKKFKD